MFHFVGVDNRKLNDLIQDEVQSNTITKKLQNPVQAAVQLYILEAFDLASRDIGSFSDPYLIVRFGDKEIARRDKY
jgi:hypothetical protein